MRNINEGGTTLRRPFEEVAFCLENYYYWLRKEYKQKLNMEVDMKKVLPWVISCTFLIVYVWLMKTLSLWGLEYIVVFSFFAFVPLIPFLAPFLGILMFFNNKKLVITGYLLSLTTGIYLVNALRSYPIRIYMSGEMTDEQYLSLIFSLVSYLLISTVCFICRMKMLKHHSVR